ncbi:MAG: threonylcarbamoyl-AMP synthase [Clostridia bacterium]|nr:threonylcarbamoyl-AMP synthase [Clostridia bacterium]
MKSGKMMVETKLFKYEPSDSDMLSAVGAILRDGGIAGIPTETVYGLAANAFDGKAVAKIFKAKGRPQDNPLIVHISDISQLDSVVSHIPPSAYALAEKFWPGPLSIIMPKGERIPNEVSCGLDTVAVRMPSHPGARDIISAAGVPLAAPSANLSGSPSPTTAQHVIDDMWGRADAIVDGGMCDVGVESTVVSLVGKKPRLLRPGGVSLEQLESVLGEVEVDSAVLAELEPGQKAASPGMKYKHYSPKARVIIIKGSFDNYRRFVMGKKDCAALCFDGEGDKLDIPFIEIGREHDSTAQAHLIFDVLRKLDEMGVDTAYARCPDTDGVGLAVINRLLRAAAFTVLDVDGAMLIGLTGATGSGKSTVAKMLCEKYGFAHIDCDKIAREITADGSPVLSQLAQAFGEDIIRDDMSLDRALLASRAFACEQATKLLNSITHPIITSKALAKVKDFTLEGKTAVLLDAAAIFESKIDKLCSFTAVVSAPEEVRKARIIERDLITAEKAEERIRAQLSDGEYERNADVIIANFPPHNIETEIQKLIQKYEEKRQ